MSAIDLSHPDDLCEPSRNSKVEFSLITHTHTDTFTCVHVVCVFVCTRFAVEELSE